MLVGLTEFMLPKILTELISELKLNMNYQMELYLQEDGVDLKMMDQPLEQLL